MFNFWQEQVIFLFSQTSRSSLEPTHWGINLTHNLHFLPRLRMLGSVCLLPCLPSLYAQKQIYLSCWVWCSRLNLWDWKQLLVSCNEHGIFWLHQRQGISPGNLSMIFSWEILVCSSLHSIAQKPNTSVLYTLKITLGEWQNWRGWLMQGNILLCGFLSSCWIKPLAST